MKRIILSTLFMLFFTFSSSAYAQQFDVVFSALNVNGRETRTEGDEWVEIHNRSDSAISLNGWSITASDGQRFSFPWDANIQANQKCRVYTNGSGPGCIFNWGQGSAQWNNTGGDCATLLSRAGQVTQFCYDYDVAEGQIINPSNPPSQTPSQPNTGGGNSGGSGQPCPASGSWPPGCIPGGSPSQPNTGGGNSGGSGQPCPASGSWPPGCIPGGASPQPGGGAGQPCPTSGAWPSGCVPNRYISIL